MGVHRNSVRLLALALGGLHVIGVYSVTHSRHPYPRSSLFSDSPEVGSSRYQHLHARRQSSQYPPGATAGRLVRVFWPGNGWVTGRLRRPSFQRAGVWEVEYANGYRSVHNLASRSTHWIWADEEDANRPPLHDSHRRRTPRVVDESDVESKSAEHVEKLGGRRLNRPAQPNGTESAANEARIAPPSKSPVSSIDDSDDAAELLRKDGLHVSTANLDWTRTAKLSPEEEAVLDEFVEVDAILPGSISPELRQLYAAASRASSAHTSDAFPTETAGLQSQAARAELLE